ncbi:MAG: hypothetical protein C0622_12860 [Desulfuromonas sp.]|nr:MAG: hypothetical protein C0622_12860 [Desulfuromonas sp.]
MSPPYPYQRLLAIGDIHGHLDELRELLHRVQPTEHDRVVFLGDYIDRGPDSRGVLDELIWFAERFPQTIFLRGNHEQMFLDAVLWDEIEALRQRNDLPTKTWRSGWNELEQRADYFHLEVSALKRIWWMEGGQQTTVSFAGDLANVRPVHRAFLNETRLFHEELIGGDGQGYGPERAFLFVHGQIDTRLPPGLQHPLELMNARCSSEPPATTLWTLVHGHTPRLDGPELKTNRINLDTGCHYGGRLTCCDVLSRRIWQV